MGVEPLTPQAHLFHLLVTDGEGAVSDAEVLLGDLAIDPRTYQGEFVAIQTELGEKCVIQCIRKNPNAPSNNEMCFGKLTRSQWDAILERARALKQQPNP